MTLISSSSHPTEELVLDGEAAMELVRLFTPVVGRTDKAMHREVPGPFTLPDSLGSMPDTANLMNGGVNVDS